VEDVDLWHYSVTAWRPLCRADAPNQRTTQIVAHVTCAECLDECKKRVELLHKIFGPVVQETV
jgi:hypothetical protein